MPENLQIHNSYIQNKIYTIRGERVMIDRDLAEIYGVETRTLNQAVKRNSERFPSDFMFQLTDIEFQHWKSQIVISNAVNLGLRKKPFVFTELGVAMLSSVNCMLTKKQNLKPKNKIGYLTNKNEDE